MAACQHPVSGEGTGRCSLAETASRQRDQARSIAMQLEQELAEAVALLRAPDHEHFCVRGLACSCQLAHVEAFLASLASLDSDAPSAAFEGVGEAPDGAVAAAPPGGAA